MLITRGGDFFARAVCKGFSESSTSVLDLPDEDPDTVACLLLFIYSDEYNEITASDLCADSEIPLSARNNRQTPSPDAVDAEGNESVKRCRYHAKIYAAAVKYCLTHLADLVRI